jgi:hypothetical protein
MSSVQAEVKLKPPIGTPSWYINFFKKLTRVKVDRVDKDFLTTNKIVPESNVTAVISGLKFLNLIKDDGSVTDNVKSLDIEGSEYEKNLENVIREAYVILFSKIKQLDQSPYEDLLNCFKSDYKMAPSTAQQATRIFIPLAQRAGIKLSEQILERSKPDVERKKPKPESGKPPKERSRKIKEKEGEEKQLPDSVFARLILKDTGYVDIKNKEDFEIATAYWKVISKKMEAYDENK